MNGVTVLVWVLFSQVFFWLGFLLCAILVAAKRGNQDVELDGMKDPKMMTDVEVALALDCLMTDTDDRIDGLIIEAAYRLARAGGGPLDPREADRLDGVITRAYRAGLADGSQSPSLCVVNR